MFVSLTTAIILAVLASDPLPGAPAITKEQEKLIELMGDNEFRVREKATADLAKLDYDGLRAMHKAAQSGDAEIRARATRLLNSYYGCAGNSKGDIPGIQGLYEMKSWKLKSGKTMEIKESDANDYYKAAGGDSEDMTERQDANNYKTREATSIMVKKLRAKGFSREDVKEVLDKITEEGNGNEMGNPGWKKFREMQGLPEYEPGPGLGFGFGIGIRNLFFRGRPFMPPAKD